VEGQRVNLVVCLPTITRPHKATLAALEASYPAVTAAGYDFNLVAEIGNVYISAARSVMLRKALRADADVVVFIDHDVSWRPQDLVALLEARGEVVAGTYRFKSEPEEYMGFPLADNGRTMIRRDGAIEMSCVPAGFLKVTRAAVDRFAKGYPHLVYGVKVGEPSVDLFNHGAHGDVWYGEDYAFSRNWRALGEPLWLLPQLRIDHHAGDYVYPGCYHEYLLAEQRKEAA
jgi:glycosyltransferase involved in cell wall biosynthesis